MKLTLLVLSLALGGSMLLSNAVSAQSADGSDDKVKRLEQELEDEKSKNVSSDDNRSQSSLKDLKKQRKEAKKRAKDARSIQRDANDASKQAKRAYKAERNAQKARRDAERQAERARKAQRASEANK